MTAAASQPFNNLQPYLALTEVISVNGYYPQRGPNDTTSPSGQGYTADLHIFAGNFTPAGTALTNGALQSISENSALYSLLGTTYGGNGSTTFQLPNLGGRVAVEDASALPIGVTAGSEAVTLTDAQVPGGGGAAFDDRQPELSIHLGVRALGDGEGGYTGEIVQSAFATSDDGAAQPGVIPLDGRTLTISDHPDLFAVIGTRYGGDGVTSFAVPDERGHGLIGAGPNDTLGAQVGHDSLTLTTANLPPSFGGSGTALDNRASGLVVNYMISLGGIYPARDGSYDTFGNGEPVYGEVRATLSSTAPDGWALAQGQLLPISQNQALFSLLGTTYGGDGRTTFALPDLRDRVVIASGASTASGADYVLGQTGGAASVTLAPAQTPDRFAPANTVPSAQTTDADHHITFSSAAGTALSVSDEDNTRLSTTLNVAHGTLKVGSAPSGLAISGDGTAGVVVIGATSLVNAALSGLVYTATAGYTGADTLTVSTHDGQLTTSGSVALTVTNPPVVAAGGFTTADVRGATVTGGASAALAGDSAPGGGTLTVSAVNGAAGGVGTPVAGTYGHLTLNADGAYSYVADTTTAIDAAAVGSAPVDSFTFTVSSPGGTTPETFKVAIDRPPAISGGAASTYTERGVATAAAPTLTLADPDASAISGAVVTITTGFLSGDQLGFATQNGISGGYDAATGRLTLTGQASPAQYQAALESVTFSNSGSNPTSYGADGSRTLSVQVTDAGGASASANATVNVTAVNDAPVLGGGGGSVGYTERGTAVTVGTGVAVSDADSVNLTGATATISAGAQPDDVLGFTAQGNITGSYDALSHVLTLTGTGTVAQYQAVLDSVTFSSTSHDPTAGGTAATRTITFAADDGQSANHASNTVSATINLTAVNDAPTLTGTHASSVDDRATATPFSGVTAGDPDTGQTETATISYAAAAGSLSYGAGATGVTFAGSAGSYTLSAGSTAALTTALRAVSFTPTATGTGASTDTTFTLAVSDGTAASAADAATVVTVTHTTNTPVSASNGATSAQAITDKQTATPFAQVTVGDGGDAGQTYRAAISYTAANGALAGTAPPSGTALTGSAGSYTLTAGTAADLQTALAALVFTPAADQVAPGSAAVSTTFSVAVSDLSGTTVLSTATVTDTVAATSVNDAPTISGAAAGQAVNSNTTLHPFGAVTVADPDSGASETVTITLTAGGTASDADGMLSGTGLTRTGVGTYALAAGSPAAVTGALQALTFTPTPDQAPPGGTVTTGTTLSVSDGIAASPTADNATTVVATNAGNAFMVAAGTTTTIFTPQTYTGKTQLYGELDVASGGSVASSQQVALKGSSAVFDVSGAGAGHATVTIQELSGVSGSVIRLGTAVLSITETVAATFSGTIVDASGGASVASFTDAVGVNGVGVSSGGILVNGSAPLTLAGANTYTGKTQVIGQLNLGAGGSLASSQQVALKASGAVFDVSGAGTGGALVTVNELSGVAGSTIRLGSGVLAVNETAAAGYAGVIADGGAAGGSGGSLFVNGTAALTLSGANTFTGGVTLRGGVLELASRTAAGVGHALTFAGAATLQLDAGALSGSGTAHSYGTPIAGFAAGDHIDLASLAYAADASATYAGTTLTVTSGSSTVALTVTGLAMNAAFTAADDGHGHVLVGLVGAG